MTRKNLYLFSTGKFYGNIFDPQLVEFSDVEPVNSGGLLAYVEHVPLLPKVLWRLLLLLG